MIENIKNEKQNNAPCFVCFIDFRASDVQLLFNTWESKDFKL